MNVYCHGPMTCSVSESVHIGTSWKLKIPGNFNILGIKSGVRIQRSWTVSTETSRYPEDSQETRRASQKASLGV